MGLTSSPQPFWHQEPVLWKSVFPRAGGTSGCFPVDSSTLMCTLFLYYDISSTSDHQALGSRGWGPRLRLLCLVTQLCPILCNSRDCNPPGSSVHGILQARILDWVAMPSSRASSQPRDQIHNSCIGRQVLYHRATRIPHALSQKTKT